MSLNASALELTNCLKAARQVWDRARENWDDAVARDFEALTWQVLDTGVRATVQAMDRLAPILERARRECSAESSSWNE